MSKILIHKWRRTVVTLAIHQREGNQNGKVAQRQRDAAEPAVIAPLLPEPVRKSVPMMEDGRDKRRPTFH